ncbi:MAG: GerMN domain-containing protein [Armatimonadetes bacterium]|nr:GerMN domain-containing protein [Armatimonadota bacterium]
MKNGPLLIAALIVLVGLCVVLGMYLARQNSVVPTGTTVEKPVPTKEDSEKTREVTVYRVVVENNQPRLREKTALVSGDPIEAALKELIGQVGKPDSTNPIPKGTRLLGVEVKDGVAEVDFSREFRDNFKGGSEGEALLLAVITRTLRQFGEVKTARLLVEGRPLDTLGHADLSEPLDVRGLGSEFDVEQ